MFRDERGNGIDVTLARRQDGLLEHLLGCAVVHQPSGGSSQQVHDGGLRVLGCAGCFHGAAEMCEPPSGLVGTDQPMDVTALHADISDAAHLAAEDHLEELLETFPFIGPAAPKETSERPIALETVVEAIDDHADPGPASKRDEQLRACGHRRRLARGTYHVSIIAKRTRRRAAAPAGSASGSGCCGSPVGRAQGWIIP